MASKRQIEANRRNAKHSTGPKTDAGRLASARNARRHGLSMPMEHNESLAAAVLGLAQALNKDDTVEGYNLTARETAERHLEVRRVRQARCAAILKVLTETKHCLLKYNLPGFDRYERSATSRRRRGLSVLLKI